MELELPPEMFQEMVGYFAICGTERKRKKLRERRRWLLYILCAVQSVFGLGIAGMVSVYLIYYL